MTNTLAPPVNNRTQTFQWLCSNSRRRHLKTTDPVKIILHRVERISDIIIFIKQPDTFYNRTPWLCKLVLFQSSADLSGNTSLQNAFLVQACDKNCCSCQSTLRYSYFNLSLMYYSMKFGVVLIYIGCFSSMRLQLPLYLKIPPWALCKAPSNGSRLVAPWGKILNKCQNSVHLRQRHCTA